MKNMKLRNLTVQLAVFCSTIFSLIFFAACNNSAEQQQKNVDDLNAFVQRHKDSVEVFAHNAWSSLDSEFSAKRKKIDQDTTRMNESLKASYYDAVRNWEGFQNAYSIRQSEDQKLGEMDAIRKSLAPTGIRPDFTDLVTPQLQAAYEHFVNTVRANKDVYTKEQWTVVNVSWKALNGRKRELEKDIDGSLSGKITKLQMQYTSIKALNRPSAPTE